MVTRSRGNSRSPAPQRSTPRLRTRLGRPAPSRPELTPRGERTKAKLVAAARAIFETQGFLEARITDIADRAKVAHGTFYTYFDSKEAIFRAVAEQMMSEITPAEVDIEGADPFTLISEANRQYWETFRANRGLFQALEQVASFNQEGRDMRREFRHHYERAARARITAWQAKGVASSELDPTLLAMAVTALVGRFVQVCLALEDESADAISQDEALALLDTLYCRSLGIETARPKRSRST